MVAALNIQPYMSFYPSVANFWVISLTTESRGFGCFHISKLDCILLFPSWAPQRMIAWMSSTVSPFHSTSSSARFCWGWRWGGRAVSGPVSPTRTNRSATGNSMLLFSMVSSPTEDKCVATEEMFSRFVGLLFCPKFKVARSCIFQRMRRSVWRRTCPPRA